MEFTAATIAGFLGGTVDGDPQAAVTTFAKIEEGHPGALSFLANPKYEHYIYETRSTIVVVNSSFVPSSPVSATLVRVEDAYGSFARLLELYAASKPRRKGISPLASVASDASLGSECYVGDFAVVESGARIGDGVQIYPQCYVGRGVEIGSESTLYAGVKIYEGCRIGRRAVLHAGCVIGADGFGFAPDSDGRYGKIPQIGNVVVDDDVEIGANTCIDRATMGSTRVGRGVKLDNLIQLGHNVTVGENTVMAAQAGVAGSTHVGRNCMFGGQVGLAGHITIGDGVKVASKSGISNNVPEGLTMSGYPATPGTSMHRSHAVYRNLPELQRRLAALEKLVKQMQESCPPTAEKQ